MSNEAMSGVGREIFQPFLFDDRDLCKFDAVDRQLRVIEVDVVGGIEELPVNNQLALCRRWSGWCSVDQGCRCSNECERQQPYKYNADPFWIRCSWRSLSYSSGLGVEIDCPYRSPMEHF